MDTEDKKQIELIRPVEAARLIGISRTKIYEMLQRNELPVVRFGRSVRIPVARLREWVATNTTAA